MIRRTVCALPLTGIAAATVGVGPVRAQTPHPVTAFIDVAVIPMDRERVLPHQTVVVQGDKIVAMGPSKTVRVPGAAARVDGRGKFLMPGLGDCHVHIGYNAGPEYNLPPDSVIALRLLRWLADGVTTVRNLDYVRDGKKSWLLDGDDALQLRARVAAGKLRGPRIYTAGEWGPGHYTNVAKAVATPNLDSVAIYVAAYKAAGYDVLKIHEETPAVAEAVFAAARQVDLPVVGHVKTSLRAALAGMQSIEHMGGGPRSGYPYDGFTSDSIGGYPWDDSISDSAARILAKETKQAGIWNCVTMQVGGQVTHKSLRALRDVGAGLLLGTDYPMGRIHRELELLVQAGLTPYEALATGTTQFAQYLKTIDETGTIAVGKRADLVLLDDNPLQNITNVRRRVGVMLGGRWFPIEELSDGLLGFPRQWFQAELLDVGVMYVDEIGVIYADETSPEQQRRVKDHVGKILRMSDSLRATVPQSPDYARWIQELAHELGAMRRVLGPTQYPTFDPMARVWLRVQTRRGYKVEITGVAP